MNNYADTQSSAGILKNAYPSGGPVSQMNQNSPMMAAIRKKRDALKR